MAKLSIPKLEAQRFRGWPFVFVAGVVLAVVALLDDGYLSGPTGQTGCIVTVTSTSPLKVWVGPSASAAAAGNQLAVGARVDAKPVVQDGYRQLADGNWAAAQYLRPESVGGCG